MASALKCSAHATHVLAIGVQVSLADNAAARQAAHAIATDLQSSFRAHLQLQLHGMCHGALRVPPHGLTPARPSRPQISAPDAACTHAGEELSTTCLPLWRVELYKGACVAADVTVGGRTVSLPQAAPPRESDVSFTAPSVDLFKTTCREAFPSFPAGWKAGYCARFSAEICTAGDPMVLRFVLEAGGAAPVPASLVLDGRSAAFVENVPAAAASDQLLAWATSKSRDVIAVLGRGCHSVQVVYHDAPEGDKLAWGEHVLVRSQNISPVSAVGGSFTNRQHPVNKFSPSGCARLMPALCACRTCQRACISACNGSTICQPLVALTCQQPATHPRASRSSTQPPKRNCSQRALTLLCTARRAVAPRIVCLCG